MTPKELVFSATKKDFRVDYFRCRGPGGQNVNKNSTGVRMTYIPLGFVTQSTKFKSRIQNKHFAWNCMVELLTSHAKQLLAADQPIPQPSTEVVRTYNKPRNLVIDKLSGLSFSYTQTVGKGNIGPLIEARRNIKQYQ